MSFTNNGHYERGSDQVRAARLPADFGEDTPEIIRLREKQAVAKAERDKAESDLAAFGNTQGVRNQSVWSAEAEIERIDSARPKLLARLILEGGDFTQDANQQRRRRELALLVERHRLASQVIGQMVKELERESQEAGRRHQSISNQIREVLHRLRLEHVAARH